MLVLIDEIVGWRAGLDDLLARFAHRFGRVEPRRQALTYLLGLLSPLASKNGWTLAEAAGDATPDRMQRLLNRSAWDPDAVRDDLFAYVAEHIGHDDGVLIVDETGFLKKGIKSAGVQRQYSGTARRTENCQLGVFLAYASPGGRTLIDRELYLPRGWCDDPARREEAGIAASVGFATKPALGLRMLERAITAGLSASWVTADEAYGQDSKFRIWLQQHRMGFVLAVPHNQRVPTTVGNSRPDVLAANAPALAWKRRSCGAGAKGHDSMTGPWPPCPARSTDTAVAADPPQHHQTHGPGLLPVLRPRRHPGRDVHPHRRNRWAIEECFQTAKTQVGLDHYQVRRYDAWYRHITLVLCAHAYLAVTAPHVKKGVSNPTRTASFPSPSARSDVCWHT
ncbi:IS701 family transposase [Micromonospora ureilytica]|uniref:IS701 family transposase n=1 Tax=Micromonospora ureilytica TaxID=709868 RepID=UPI002E110EBF|nr:IS701 family transposase [Micromonospora ureilytica]